MLLNISNCRAFTNTNANKIFGWVDFDEHVTELAPRSATREEWKNSRMTAHDWKKFSSKYTAKRKSAEAVAKALSVRESATKHSGRESTYWSNHPLIIEPLHW